MANGNQMHVFDNPMTSDNSRGFLVSGFKGANNCRRTMHICGFVSNEINTRTFNKYMYRLQTLIPWSHGWMELFNHTIVRYVGSPDSTP